METNIVSEIGKMAFTADLSNIYDILMFIVLFAIISFVILIGK